MQSRGLNDVSCNNMPSFCQVETCMWDYVVLMGQTCGSLSTGMGCDFMSALFLSLWLSRSGLCASRVLQSQAAICGEAPSLWNRDTDCNSFGKVSLPRLGICSSSAFLFPVLFTYTPPLSLLCIQAASSAFFLAAP